MLNLLFLLFVFTQAFCSSRYIEEDFSEIGPAKWRIVESYPENTCSYGPGLFIFVVKPTDSFQGKEEATVTPIKVVYQDELSGKIEVLRYANIIANVTPNAQSGRSSLSVDIETSHNMHKSVSVEDNFYLINPVPIVDAVDCSTAALYYPLGFVRGEGFTYDFRISSSHAPSIQQDGKTRYAAVKIEYVVGYDTQEMFSCEKLHVVDYDVQEIFSCDKLLSKYSA